MLGTHVNYTCNPSAQLKCGIPSSSHPAPKRLPTTVVIAATCGAVGLVLIVLVVVFVVKRVHKRRHIAYTTVCFHSSAPCRARCAPQPRPSPRAPPRPPPRARPSAALLQQTVRLPLPARPCIPHGTVPRAQPSALLLLLLLRLLSPSLSFLVFLSLATSWISTVFQTQNTSYSPHACLSDTLHPALSC